MFGIKTAGLQCENCLLLKLHRLPFKGHIPSATQVLETIFMDLSGKITPASLLGGRYYFKLTNWFTVYRFVYILKNKSDAYASFVSFAKNLENIKSATIKNVVCDGGGEFNSKEFLSFFEEKNITVHITSPHTPQQNSVAKRGNCITSEKAKALLKQAGLPSTYWAEAVVTAVFLENVTPRRKSS